MSDSAETVPLETVAAEPVVDSGTAVEAPAVVVEPVVEPTAEAHTDTPSLLTGDLPAEEVPGAEVAEAVVEAVAEAEEAKPEDKPAEEVAKDPEAPVVLEPLAYEPLTVPEGVSFDEQRVKAFDEVIAPHRLPPEARQQLADLHVAEMQRQAENLSRDQHRIFAETRAEWRREVTEDEQLGGSGHRTALGACMRMIDEFVPANQRESFDQMLLVTGAGDHPAMLRFLHNLSRKYDAPASPTPPNNPPPDRGGGAGRGKRLRDFYDKTQFR